MDDDDDDGDDDDGDDYDDDEMSVSLVQETGAPGFHHRSDDVGRQTLHAST